jgi:hypothetical protein
VDITEQYIKDSKSHRSWIDDFMVDLIPTALERRTPVEGLILKNDIHRCKLVDKEWFLGLTRHNYSFRKKLFKTSHKKTSSVGDVHFQGIAKGLPKRLCDTLAIHGTIDEYLNYLPNKDLFTPAVQDRNKEAVYTSLKRYGW